MRRRQKLRILPNGIILFEITNVRMNYVLFIALKTGFHHHHFEENEVNEEHVEFTQKYNNR